MRKNILILGHNDATQFIDIFNQYTQLFDKDKYEVTVAYLTGKPKEETKRRTIAEHTIFLDVPKKSIRTLKINAIRKLLRLCREKQFQLVICHRYKPTYIMLWVSQFYKIPALFFVMHELRTMAPITRQWLIAALARKNMIFGGVSDAVRDDMRKNLWCIPKDRVITLYNMIDVDLTLPHYYSREEARSRLHLAEDDIVFGNVARLAHNKDQTSLIQAFSLIKPHCPKAKLIIIGAGELESRLKEQAAALQLTHDVIFTGYLSCGFRYMKAFDCFVLPSIQEAFGRVLLEAMLAKTPVIASRVNGIPEVLGETGILIQPKDPTGLASAIQQIYHLSSQEREAWGQKGYDRAFNHFSIPTFQEQFWQLPLVQFLKE